MRATLWLLGICASVAGLVVTARLKPAYASMAYAHMALAAVSAIGIALGAMLAMRAGSADTQRQTTATAGKGLHYLGLVWTWAVLALFVTYAFVLQWREWWHFVLAFIVLAGLCLWMATALRKESESASADDALLRFARILAYIHLGAGVVTMAGLIIDGKMVRFLVARHQDWAAQNIFFFGALALTAISWSTLAATRPPPPR